MTTLTPYRTSLLEALEQAEEQLKAVPVTASEQYAQEMSMGIFRGGMLPIADMLDRDIGFEEIGRSLESALANFLISHSLNFTGGDKRQAGLLAVRLLANVRDLTQRRLAADRPDVHVYRPVPHPTTTGRA